MTRHSTSPRAALVSSLLVLALLLLLAWRWFDNWPWRADYSTRPAAKVFQEVMGQPVPKGLSQLRIAGRHYLLKKWVWMRFRATDEAVKSLLREHSAVDEPLDEASTHRAINRTQRSGNERWNKYDDEDRKLVRWEDVGHLTKRQVYELSSNGKGWLWDGVMIVDRKRELVYLYAHSD